MFNGDVMTQVDLAAVLRLHRERKAKATIVLTPVDNPTAYGLVETDADGNVRRFLEKPKAEEITCDTINAGIYILEPDTFDRIPKDTAWSIERSYFPSLVERGETFVAYVYRGYWIDIGTPEKYAAGAPRHHGRPVLGAARSRARRSASRWCRPDARIEDGATVEGPCFIDEGAIVKAGARIGPYTVIGRQCHIEEDARIEGSIVWANCRDRPRRASSGSRSSAATATSAATSILDAGVVLGDKSAVTDYSRL